MTKPRLLYYVHAHGSGHLAIFKLLEPELSKYFEIIALTTNVRATEALQGMDNILVHELPAKWGPLDIPPKHTFSKAFEETPYSKYPAERIAKLLDIVQRHQPVAFFCDGSPELAIAARSMGVPIVLVHLLGNTMIDPTQVFTYELSDHIIANFPKALQTPGYNYTDKTYYSGFISRYAAKALLETPDETITILMGTDNYSQELVSRMTADPSRNFVIIGNNHEYALEDNCVQLGYQTDVAQAISGNIVITAAGQNSVAELLSLGKTLIVLPEDRPYDEQKYNAMALSDNDMALIADDQMDADEWRELLETATDFEACYAECISPDAPANIAQLLRSWYA